MKTFTTLALLTAVALPIIPTAASAQEVVMRRPIPNGEADGNGVTPVDPQNPTVVVPDPVSALCDQGAQSPTAKLTEVQWVEQGWSAPTGGSSCKVQRMEYGCQATYSCEVDGQTQTFTSVAPDATCEGTTEEVRYPPGAVDPTAYPENGSIDDQARYVGEALNRMATGFGAPREDGQKPAGLDKLAKSAWVRNDMIFAYDHWYTGGWALRVYFNDTPWGPYCQAIKKYTGKQCDNYGAWGTWIYYKL